MVSPKSVITQGIWDAIGACGEGEAPLASAKGNHPCLKHGWSGKDGRESMRPNSLQVALAEIEVQEGQIDPDAVHPDAQDDNHPGGVRDIAMARKIQMEGKEFPDEQDP